VANKRPPRPAKRSMKHRMTWTIVYCLAAGPLAPFAVGAQTAESPLCEVGRSVIDLMYFESSAADAQIAPATLRASILFLEECPASVLPAIRESAARGPWPAQDRMSTLRHAWIEAARTAARDSANADLRALLVAAKASVARVGNHVLSEFLDGIFDGVANGREAGAPSLEPAVQRLALAVLRDNANCDGAECYGASDDVLFLLGTYPTAVVMAMRSDSAGAAQWLANVAHESFSGIRELEESREGARRAVLKRLSETQAPGFEPELRACQDRLREIRYRPVE